MDHMQIICALHLAPDRSPRQHLIAQFLMLLIHEDQPAVRKQWRHFKLRNLVSFKIYLKVSLSALLAICRRPSVCRLSACLSSVCNTRAPYSAGWIFRQYFYGISTLKVLNAVEILPKCQQTTDGRAIAYSEREH